MSADSVEMLLLTMLTVILGWLFKLITDNRKYVKEVEEYRRQEHQKFIEIVGVERDRCQKADNELHDRLDKNCAAVSKRLEEMNDRLEAHKLHVANNYVRDSKIETMIKHYTQPIHDQLGMLQTTLNTLLVKIQATELHDKK